MSLVMLWQSCSSRGDKSRVTHVWNKAGQSLTIEWERTGQNRIGCWGLHCITLIENGELFFESLVQQQGKGTSLVLKNIDICARTKSSLRLDYLLNRFKSGVFIQLSRLFAISCHSLEVVFYLQDLSSIPTNYYLRAIGKSYFLPI